MKNLDAASNDGKLLRLTNSRRGMKRNSGFLEDNTNFSRDDKMQIKRRKQYVERFGKENLKREMIKKPLTEAQVNASEIVLATPTYESKTINIFPCDIDRCKKDGHLFSMEYLPPIASAVDSNEKKSVQLFPKPNYFKNQTNLRPHMRTILFSWLVEVHQKFELREVVLWMAFQICDRFLTKVNVDRKNLQLVGCISLWIASKYHEIYPPMAQDLVFISDGAFTKDNLLNMECRICDVLGFKFSIPNAFQFLDRYTNVAMDSVKEFRLKKRVKWLARYAMERFIIDSRALKYRPSLLAAGALYTALRLTSHQWSRSCEVCSGYTEAQLAQKLSQQGEQSIFEFMKRTIMHFDSQSQRAIILKYQTPDRGSVSTLRKKEKKVR